MKGVKGVVLNYFQPLPTRIDDFQSGVIEVFLVVRNQAQFVMQCSGGQQAVSAEGSQKGQSSA